MAYECRLTVAYIPLPPERQAEWWEGMRELLELLKAERSRADGVPTALVDGDERTECSSPIE
jgi:hypothetical protein